MHLKKSTTRKPRMSKTEKISAGKMGAQEESCAYHIGLGRSELPRNRPSPQCINGVISLEHQGNWTTAFAESWAWLIRTGGGGFEWRSDH